MRRLLRVLLVLLLVLVAVGAAGSCIAGDAPRQHRRVLDQLVELEALLRAEDILVEDVSAWSVHKHVEHLLLANEGIFAMIAAGAAPDPVEPKSWLGRLVLLTGRIPRGRGQAPEGTVPAGLPRDALLALHARVKEAARTLDATALPEGVVGNHPVFGGFTATDWLRLMAVHDDHHLAIVADVEAAAGGTVAD